MVDKKYGARKVRWRAPVHMALLLAWTGIACGASPPAASSAGQAVTPAAPAVSTITTKVVSAGALTCARRVNDVVAYLAGPALQDALLFPLAPSGPDQRLLSLSAELVTSGQPGAYVSATFSPTATGSCDTVYDAVKWWPASCDAVSRSGFAGLRTQSVLAHNVLVLDGGDAMKVFLMPAGNGCVSIKKEVVR